MAKKIKRILVDGHIDCACLIHDTLYGFEYVDKLYRALQRNLTPEVRLHVYTEKDREVPAPYIKHALVEWPDIRGPKKSWWYKVQLFDTKHHSGKMLYFDLDTVIVNNLDWIWENCDTRLFWAARDFKYLFRPKRTTINSSVMWFDTALWGNVWSEFDYKKVRYRTARWHGDQDYIHEIIPDDKKGYFDQNRVMSWKWQLVDGGYNFETRKHRIPGQGTIINDPTSVLVFHGDPKPHEITDANVLQHWV